MFCNGINFNTVINSREIPETTPPKNIVNSKTLTLSLLLNVGTTKSSKDWNKAVTLRPLMITEPKKTPAKSDRRTRFDKMAKSIAIIGGNNERKLFSIMFQNSLRCSQPSDWHPERAARNIVESCLVEKHY